MTSSKHASHRSGSTFRRARLAALLPGLALWASGTVALADDTEILTGEIGDYAAPNILFVIDTSGSMGGQVLVDDSYNPNFSYSGPYTEADRLYYVLADSSGNFIYPDDSYIGLGAYIKRDKLVCDQANTLLNGGNGFYVDRFIQFDPNDSEWGFLQGDDPDPTRSGVDRLTECFSDDGLHGTDAGSADTYPADIDNLVPFTSDPNSPDRFNWATYPLNYAFFNNNYLNWISERAASGTPVVQTRLEVVQGVTRNLITRLTASGDDPRQQFNVGLMRFSTNAQGGMVLQPVDDISIASVQQDFLTAVDSMSPSNNTPLSETLYEAYQYMRGGPVDYGTTSAPQTSVATSYTGTLGNGASYISPIEASCQKNYIVLLTDGLPTTDTDADGRIAAITGATCVGNCLDDLSIHMNQTDMMPLMADDQFIDTFTIGFFTDSTLLANTATGEVQPDEDQPPIPGYFLADNVTELSRAFDAIFTEIETDVTTFTSPAASVNALNRLQNRDILYFTVFEPSPMGEPHWDGNLKAYRLGRPAGGTVDTALTILDADRLPALNDDNTFRTTARSIWSPSDDGGNVTAGGFISRLSANRTILTNLGGTGALTDIGTDPDSITAEMLGIAAMPGIQGQADAEARRLELLDFARGIDENGEPLRMMGDPLHTQPLVITYAGGEDNLGLVATTNDGYMHFLDPTPTDGNIEDLEEWAFIPQDLLRNVDLIERNPPSLPGSNNKLYGLDGPLTMYVPGDIDRIVDPDERLYVYSAMRRGGSSYYAMDLGVGGDNAPRLAFEIKRDSTFTNLGQSWSSATPATVLLDGSSRDVLIFGGGYDPRQDNDGSYGQTTDKGNAIYMADAETGELVWWASNTSTAADLKLDGMDYAIPSDVAVLDINGDGITDRLYVGDMAGQVWRVDLLESGIFGAKFAALGEPGSAAGERRFYNAPSVARVFDRNANFLTVSIGSGWRAHPLATENSDRLYVLKDLNVFAPPVDVNNNPVYPAALTNADLVQISVNPPMPADASLLTGAGGWYLELESGGEKNLSSALTADGKVFFTTYRPENGPLTCQPTVSVGRGRLYVLDILTGEPALINADGTYSAFEDQPNSGILPSPQLVFVEPPCVENCDNVGPDPDPEDPDPVYATVGGNCLNAVSEVTAVLGIRNIPTDICTAPERSYWSEADGDELDDL